MKKTSLEQISQVNEDIKPQMSNDKPTPLGNIRILESQIKNILEKKSKLEQNLLLLNDKEIDLETCEKIEKEEEELDFLNGYYRTLRDQLVVIMNEHNVVIPPQSIM